LDRLHQLTLVRGARSGDPAREDLRPLGDVVLERPQILVVDPARLVLAELAVLPPAEQEPPPASGSRSARAAAASPRTSSRPAPSAFSRVTHVELLLSAWERVSRARRIRFRRRRAPARPERRPLPSRSPRRGPLRPRRAPVRRAPPALSRPPPNRARDA